MTEQQISTVDVRGFALSPDGTRLAVMTDGWTPNGKSQVTTINVLPVTAAAAARSWQLTVNNKTTPANIYSVSGGLGLSWSSDGRFLATSADVDEGVVLMLDTTRPGDSLLADSRVFTLSAQVPAGVAGNRIYCGYDMVLTDDGTEIVCFAGIQHVYPNTGNQPGSPHIQEPGRVVDRDRDVLDGVRTPGVPRGGDARPVLRRLPLRGDWRDHGSRMG